MGDIDYTALIEKAPPEGMVDWLLEQGKLSKNYLIYRAGQIYEPLEERNVPVVTVKCTACGTSFHAEKIKNDGCGRYAPAPFGFQDPESGERLISGDCALCPICGTEADVKHINNIRAGHLEHCYTTVVSRAKVEGRQDRLVLTDWQTSRYIDREGNVSYRHHLWTAWVVEARKIIRIMGYRRVISTLQYIEPKQMQSFLDDYGAADMVWPFEEADLIGTTGENSKLDRYVKQGGECLVAYLALWRKKAHAENIVMSGYGKLLDELINNANGVSSYSRHKGIPQLPDINWKEKKPHRMMRLGKEEFRGEGRQLTAKGWEMLLWARANGIEASCADAELMEHFRRYGCGLLLEAAGAGDFMKAARYVRKQVDCSSQTFRDYRAAAAAAGWNMADPAVLWPRDLKAAHDRAVEAEKLKIARESAKLFRERFKALSRFSAAFDGIIIRPCRSQAELTAEGSALHHCVARYAKAVATGKTAILFIRREAEPDTPWYTLELDEKALTVRQNSGLHNCARTEEIEAFEAKWLEWCRSGCKRDKDGRAVIKNKEVKAA